ncbi:MAG TPA: ATP-binding cassette domain-containing protein [Actinomycetota bacterium]
MEEIVALTDAEVRIAGRRVLGPVTFRVLRDDRWAVLGPNGSGKTTLLRLFGAVRQPSAGTVRVLGAQLGLVDVRALRERIAFVGHAVADALPPGLSVRDVVLTGKHATLVPWLQDFDEADRAHADDLLRRLGCDHLDGQAFSACSQGERQRVLLARALFGRPELVLLDEPAAGLDLPGREALLAALDDVHELGGIATILVTHHLEELPSTITHAALLRGGGLVAAGPVAEVLLDGPMSECFGLPLQVHAEGGRWSAATRRSGPRRVPRRDHPPPEGLTRPRAPVDWRDHGDHEDAPGIAGPRTY